MTEYPASGKCRDSPACHRADDDERLRSGRDRIWQRRVGWFVREILLAGKEAQEGAAALGGVVADGSAQHWIAGLERIDDGVRRHRPLDLERHLSVDPGEPAEMVGEHHADHGSVWTSTETTAGRSRTMGAQLSPASADM